MSHLSENILKDPEIGNDVIVFFKNGATLTGKVVFWCDQKSVIETTTSIIIIQKTNDDVLFVKVSTAKQQYDNLKNKPNKDDDDIKSIAGLKSELNELERIELKEKMNTHIPNGAGIVNYELPIGNIKVKSIVEHTREEAPRKSSNFGTGLQDLFVKKH